MNVRDLILAYRTNPENRRLVLEGALKSYLNGPAFHVEGSGTISTAELAEALWPEKLAHGEDIANRAQMFRDLAVLEADGKLDGYVTTGQPVVNRYKQTILPRRWHRPIQQRRDPRLDQLERFTILSVVQDEVTSCTDPDGYYVRFADVERLFSTPEATP